MANSPYSLSETVSVKGLQPGKGSFNNHVDIISPFFDHPPTSVDIFYVLNVDKFGKF